MKCSARPAALKDIVVRKIAFLFSIVDSILSFTFLSNVKHRNKTNIKYNEIKLWSFCIEKEQKHSGIRQVNNE